MIKKGFTAVFVMGLMLFNVFVVAKPASAAEPQANILKIVQPPTYGNLFTGVFNPSPSGMTDVYTLRVWYFLNDPAVVVGPDAKYHNYRCELVDVKYNVKVPDNAYIWNGTQKRWVNPYAGKTAKSAVTWRCGLGQWNNGQPITLADFMFDLAMNYEWAFQDGNNDKYYDQAWSNSMRGILKQVWGFKVNAISNDYITYTIYQNFIVPYDRWETAIGNYYEYPSVPWELYNLMSQMAANGVGGKTFSWSDHPQNGYQLDMIDPEQAQYFKQEAQTLLNSGNLIPVWLSTLDPVLKEWGISKEQAGITNDLAKRGYQDIIECINNHRNVLISNGPYYVEEYNLETLTLILKLANNKRIGFATDEINGIKIPWEPHWEEIQIHGVTNTQTAISGVAKGDYDVYWKEISPKNLSNMDTAYTKNLNTIGTITNWLSLDLNLVGDPQTGLVNSDGTEKFNPFALREIRYAMNWLINRNYIVNNILNGGGAPMFGPQVSGQVDAASRINLVAKALGFTAQGDEQYALKMINDAMNKAAQNLREKGYTLEKKDGVWYFNGQPVTVKVIARSDDPNRLAEGKYIAQLLERAGFDVEILQWTRTQASKTVYSSDPTTLQWHVYTEGWIKSGIESVTSLAWDFWFFDYYIDPNWGTDYHNPMTLNDLIQVTAGGDVNKFIQELHLKYYNTPDKLEPLIDWTGYDFAMLLASNSWTDPGNYAVSIENLDQFWDIYEIAYGLHAINAPRIYTAEAWNYYITNKRITVMMPDPISGLGSFCALRSIAPSAGHITLNSNPPGAYVYINDTYKGQTPLTLELRAGSYTIRLSKPNYEDYITIVSLSPGETKTISATLKPAYGFLSIESDPSGANVYIDGHYVGTTPLTDYKLSPGEHEVKIKKGGYNEYTKTVTITPGEKKTLSASLVLLPPPTTTTTTSGTTTTSSTTNPTTTTTTTTTTSSTPTTTTTTTTTPLASSSETSPAQTSGGSNFSPIYLAGALIGILLIGGIAAKAVRKKPEKPLKETKESVRKQESTERGESSMPVLEDKSSIPGFPAELLDRYEPLEFLGEGGFAKVFKAKRRKDDRIAALKIPRIDERTSKTFIKEVSTWLHLDHPNIVKLYDVDILPVPYLEMEFVEGAEVDGKLVRTLEELPKPVDEETALGLIKGIAEGLKHAH